MYYGFDPDPGEKVIKVVHRHIFDIAGPLFMTATLCVVAMALAYIAGRYPDYAPFPSYLTGLIALAMLAVAAVMFFVTIWVWRHNLLIFTNMHLIIIEQVSLFHRRVSQLNFTRVEDVSGRRSGFIQTVFDYGDVQVQTSSEQEKFIFKNAPAPHQLADYALQIHETLQPSPVSRLADPHIPAEPAAVPVDPTDPTRPAQ